MMKLDAVHAHGDDWAVAIQSLQFVISPNRPSLVDVAQDHAAKDCSVGICVPWHHDYLQSQMAAFMLIGQLVIPMLSWLTIELVAVTV